MTPSYILSNGGKTLLQTRITPQLFHPTEEKTPLATDQNDISSEGRNDYPIGTRMTS